MFKFWSQLNLSAIVINAFGAIFFTKELIEIEIMIFATVFVAILVCGLAKRKIIFCLLWDETKSHFEFINEISTFGNEQMKTERSGSAFIEGIVAFEWVASPALSV